MISGIRQKFPDRVTPKEAYENLANAVVLQAFVDYVLLLKHDIDCCKSVSRTELEIFFNGQILPIYTSIPGNVLLELARRKAKEQGNVIQFE